MVLLESADWLLMLLEDTQMIQGVFLGSFQRFPGLAGVSGMYFVLVLFYFEGDPETNVMIYPFLMFQTWIHLQGIQSLGRPSCRLSIHSLCPRSTIHPGSPFTPQPHWHLLQLQSNCRLDIRCWDWRSKPMQPTSMDLQGGIVFLWVSSVVFTGNNELLHNILFRTVTRQFQIWVSSEQCLP